MLNEPQNETRVLGGKMKILFILNFHSLTLVENIRILVCVARAMARRAGAWLCTQEPLGQSLALWSTEHLREWPGASSSRRPKKKDFRFSVHYHGCSFHTGALYSMAFE